MRKDMIRIMSYKDTAREEILSRVGLLTRRVTFIGCGGEAERVFGELLHEQLATDSLHEMTAAALLWHFLAIAGRQAERHATGGSHLYERIEAVAGYMRDHYREPLSIADCAARCHLSEGRFAHLFRACMGISPRQYLIGIRIGVACRLLADTDLSVSEVARSVGIDDVNYFSRLLKKHTGASPLAHR